MSRSRRIFQLIQPLVPGTALCDGSLILKPTGYIARGFFLDTTRHKDQMKLFRVVVPLYRPFQNFSFNHSRVIEGDHFGLFHIDKRAYGESSAIVFENIRLHVEPLRRLQGPREFLAYISWMTGNRMTPVRLDFGLAHYLLGNLRQAIDIFRAMERDLADYKPRRQDMYRPVIAQVLDLLESNPVALRSLLDSWRDEHVEKLGLSASVVTPHLRLAP